MTPEVEEWRAVVGYEQWYSVSSLGRIYSERASRIMKVQRNPRYLVVNFQRANGTQHTVNLHTVVAAAFLGPRPEGLQTRHLDGNPSNNAVVNLRYGTPSENGMDTVRHGRNHNANKVACLRGHLFTPDNTYWQGTKRQCKTCKRERQWKTATSA